MPLTTDTNWATFIEMSNPVLPGKKSRKKRLVTGSKNQNNSIDSNDPTSNNSVSENKNISVDTQSSDEFDMDLYFSSLI